MVKVEVRDVQKEHESITEVWLEETSLGVNLKASNDGGLEYTLLTLSPKGVRLWLSVSESLGIKTDDKGKIALYYEQD